VRDKTKRKFLGNLLIKPSEFLKKFHHVCPCEYVHCMGVCMEPSGVSGIHSHKPSYHIAYVFFLFKYGGGDGEFFEKEKK